MRRATILSLLAALASAAAPAAPAAQEVRSEERTRVAVSAGDLNVLVAEDGAIRAAVANEDELLLTRRDGRLYFRALATGKPIPLFVEVEGREGETRLYTLLLDPLEGLPAERVVIRRHSPETGAALGAGAAGGAGRAPEPRLREIKRLLLSMARGWKPEGYGASGNTSGIYASPPDGVRIELLRSYSGSLLRGEAWSVRNIGEAPLRLDEGMPALADGAIAAAFEAAEIPPGEEAALYLVREAREERQREARR